jgi:hypothetical protein
MKDTSDVVARVEPLQILLYTTTVHRTATTGAHYSLQPEQLSLHGNTNTEQASGLHSYGIAH